VQRFILTPGPPIGHSPRWESTIGLAIGGHGRHAEDGLPWAHTVFGNLKTWLRGAYHGVSPKHLQRYLNEFEFRFNKRWHEADLFSPVLHAAIAADPFPYRHLTAERTG
jgi:hypothetical protein